LSNSDAILAEIKLSFGTGTIIVFPLKSLISDKLPIFQTIPLFPIPLKPVSSLLKIRFTVLSSGQSEAN
jgi:hypothetical protein